MSLEIASVKSAANASRSPFPSALVVRLARAIVRPGGHALLIATDNSAGGWVTIEEAAASGCSFAVEIADDVLALDADSAELGRRLEGVAAELVVEGMRPIVVASGQPGRRHLFARIADRERLVTYGQRARKLGLDVRRSIRPPGSPHRLGLPVSLLEPKDLALVLAALEPNLGSTAPCRPQSLSPRMAAALRSGDHAAHGYKSRSELIQALALAFVNAQTSEDDFIGALLDPRNAAGDKLRPRGADGASRYLHVCWRKAQERAGAQPAIAGRGDALEAIARIQAIARTYPWPSRSGAYDCALLGAHFVVAARAGRLMYHADVRTLAVGAGMSIGTVSKGNRRLRDAGWLRLVKGSRWWAGEATVWLLQIPRCAVPDGNTPITHPQAAAASAMDQGITCGNIPTNDAGGDAGECFREERQEAMAAVEATGHSADQGADVWRHGALGKASFRVWQHLHPQNSQTASDLAKVLHRTPASIRKQLRRLESWKLAIRDNAGAWLRGGGDTDHAAWILGTLGEGERQRQRHEGDRETFRLGRHVVGRPVERLRRTSGGVAAAAAVSEGQGPAGLRDARATHPRGRLR